MFNIYYQPHKKRLLEAAFFQHLVRSFPKAQVINNKFSIDPEYLNCFIQRNEIIAKLERDTLLPRQRRLKCLELLKKCPPQIKVTSNINRISFDIVIEQNQQIYYWEFQESQHRNLKNKKLKKSPLIYNAIDNNGIEVPRYLQRLIRDVWRASCFPSYTIVWYDWFERNQHTYKPELKTHFDEMCLPGKFSFRAFLS